MTSVNSVPDGLNFELNCHQRKNMSIQHIVHEVSFVELFEVNNSIVIHIERVRDPATCPKLFLVGRNSVQR